MIDDADSRSKKIFNQLLGVCVGLSGFMCACGAPCLAVDEFEQAPIEYSRRTPENPVSALQQSLDSKQAQLDYDSEHGYLASVLKRLNVPVESQVLVFSKTSMQRECISPKTPRAIYFNDDVYLGFCQAGKVIEVSVADPKLGAVFYTLEQTQAEKPKFVRQTDSCLLCHSSPRTDDVPGHLVRSLFVDTTGQPIFSAGGFMVDHTTPLENRWGGWYVSGTHGQQLHMGNKAFSRREKNPQASADEGQNVVDLKDLVVTKPYLSTHSDIVSLMVLEHQTLMHNALTKANFATQEALHYQAEFSKSLGEPTDKPLESVTRRIQNAGEELLKVLLFVDEAALTEPIRGSSGFTEKFSQAGPKDSAGRSLREFDLQQRLFKYPCSYLIYSPVFDALPGELKTYVAERLNQILTATGPEKDLTTYAYLSKEDRQTILKILQATKPSLNLGD